MTLREKAIKHFFSGLKEEEYKRYCREFVYGHINHWLLEEAMERIFWHKSNHHKLILLSNSPEDYLSEWAAQFGFDHVTGSKFESQNGVLTGKILGNHCFGIEKVNRLKSIIGDTEQYFIYGYGDSKSDMHFLNLSDKAFYRHFDLKKRYNGNESKRTV
jgi:HAD superfamily hydrolase (TIGR01490 family)